MALTLSYVLLAFLTLLLLSWGKCLLCSLSLVGSTGTVPLQPFCWFGFFWGGWCFETITPSHCS